MRQRCRGLALAVAKGTQVMGSPFTTVSLLPQRSTPVAVRKLGSANTAMLSDAFVNMTYAVLTVLYLFQTVRIYQINKHVFHTEVPRIDRYSFKQVAVLDLAYMVTFGSELAVVSMLPLFFMDTFDLSIVTAGLLGSFFGTMCVVARPGGGWPTLRGRT